MKLKNLFLIIVVLTLSIMECKISSDFCIRNFKSTCHGVYNYECNIGSEDLCSPNETICKIIANDTEARLSIEQIPECPKKRWISSACIKETNCFVRQKVPLRIKNREISLFKPTECKCIEKFKVNCGDNFCARSTSACIIIKTKSLKINEAVLLGIKKCEMNNQIVKK